MARPTVNVLGVYFVQENLHNPLILHPKTRSKNNREQILEMTPKGLQNGTTNDAYKSFQINAKTCIENDNANHQQSCFLLTGINMQIHFKHNGL